jgi:hypothetical protein
MTWAWLWQRGEVLFDPVESVTEAVLGADDEAVGGEQSQHDPSDEDSAHKHPTRIADILAEITRDDFVFMRNNRRPGDDGHNPDEISSRGYFCSKLTIEQSDKALRILHASSQKLPGGTVILCPVATRVP